MFTREPVSRAGETFDQQEARAIAEFSNHFRITFRDTGLLRLALTHRSYLSVTGKGPRESNERLEFLGDSVLGLVTSEYLYRQFPDEHEGQLTKTKSLLVSKAILSRRALAMGLGRFVLMSHSEVESGGRQRLSILADAFESVIGAVYLDQGFEAAGEFIEYWLLRGSREIVADKRHRNYKSHLQEYVQSTFRTHPVYRIRSQMGPDHSKLFLVEVMIGRRALGEGRGHNKKEAEQAAARDALEKVEKPGRHREEEREVHGPRESREGREPRESREGHEGREPRESREGREPRESREGREPRESREGREPRESREGREPRESREGREPRESREGRTIREPREPAPEAREVEEPLQAPNLADPTPTAGESRRSRRGGRAHRGRHPEAGRGVEPVLEGPTAAPMREPQITRESRRFEVEPPPRAHEEDDVEEVGRPEGPLEERRIDPFGIGSLEGPVREPSPAEPPWYDLAAEPEPEPEPEPEAEPEPEDTAAWPEPEPERAESVEEPEAREDIPRPGVPASESGPPGEPRYGRRRGRKR